jgi:hypothetical protein
MPYDPLVLNTHFQQASDTPFPAGTHGLIIPPGITTKQSLMEVYANGLHCPWFGRNWDALADALNDLSWLDGQPVVIRHHDLPFDPGRRSRLVYLDILAEAASRWQTDEPGRLTIEFPTHTLGTA